ncbi:MAG: hypothetical protein ACO3JG_13245 [Luteolibacter sp.]
MKSRGLECEPSSVANLKGDAAKVAFIDYDCIMGLMARFSEKGPGKSKMTREQLIGLISADAIRLMGMCVLRIGFFMQSTPDTEISFKMKMPCTDKPMN